MKQWRHCKLSKCQFSLFLATWANYVLVQICFLKFMKRMSFLFKVLRLTLTVAFLFVLIIMTVGNMLQSVTDNLLKLANRGSCVKSRILERSKQQSVKCYTKVKTETYLHFGVRFSDTSHPDGNLEPPPALSLTDHMYALKPTHTRTR